jgi:hypothetical protein
MALNDTRPLRSPPSVSSSITHEPDEKIPAISVSQPKEDRDPSAIPPVEKREVFENDDWEHDIINPRNWSFWKKWGAVGIVNLTPARWPGKDSRIS